MFSRLTGFARFACLAGLTSFFALAALLVTRRTVLTTFLAILVVARLTIAVTSFLSASAISSFGGGIAIAITARTPVSSFTSTATAFAPTSTTITATAATVTSAATTFTALRFLGRRGRCDRSRWTAAEKANDTGPQTRLGRYHWGNCRSRLTRLNNRCRLIRRDATNGSFHLDRLDFVLGRRRLIGVFLGGFFSLFGQLITGQLDAFFVQLIVAQALNFVCWRFQMTVGHNHQIDVVTGFNLGDIDALLIEQESANIDRNLAMDGAGIFLHRLLFEDAQNMQRGGFGRTDVTGAGTTRAGDVAGLGECRTQALT